MLASAFTTPPERMSKLLYVSLEMTREIADHVRQAEIKTLPGAGHICDLDAPEAFDRELERFLARLQSALVSS
jgi:pimeloyl-ACP methyl ester carboxylesterase